MAVNKITWAQVGRVTEPGRYMFKFGWLTITADDLAVWEQYPGAAFALYGTAAQTPSGDEIEEEPGNGIQGIGTRFVQRVGAVSGWPSPDPASAHRNLSNFRAGVGVDLQPYRDLDNDGCSPLHGCLHRSGS